MTIFAPTAFPATNNAALSLDEVQRLARKVNCKLISVSQKSRVVSFLKQGECSKHGNIRINIYWTSGTVGICLDHPRQGRTQLFRRNVDMETLRKIFKNPSAHTGAGYYQKQKAPKVVKSSRWKLAIGERVHVRGYADATIMSGLQKYPNHVDPKIKVRFDNGQAFLVNLDQLLSPTGNTIADDNDCLDLENEAKMQLKRLDEELEQIQKEKLEIQQLLFRFKQDRKKNMKNNLKVCKDIGVYIGEKGGHFKEVGDRVHVKGFADATIVSGLKTSGSYAGKIKVCYDDGATYHVDPGQLTEPAQNNIYLSRFADID